MTSYSMERQLAPKKLTNGMMVSPTPPRKEANPIPIPRTSVGYTGTHPQTGR